MKPFVDIFFIIFRITFEVFICYKIWSGLGLWIGIFAVLMTLRAELADLNEYLDKKLNETDQLVSDLRNIGKRTKY